MKRLFKSMAFLGVLLTLGAVFASYVTARSNQGNPDFLSLAKRAVVRVSILGMGTCSATIIDDKHALTAAHCVPSPPEFFGYLLQFGKPPMQLIQSRVDVIPAASNQQVDAGVLMGNFAALPKAYDVDHTKGEVFTVEQAVLCGYPLYSHQLRCEVADRVGNNFFAAVFDATVLPGQSGGAVFSLDGRLIGIIHSVNEFGQTRVASTTGVLSLTTVSLP